MRLKSYFAASVEAAMKLASQELGDDAMLVHSRRTSPEARQLGEYEVVFAVPGATPAVPAAAPTEATVTPPPRPAPWESFSSELADMRNQLQKVAGTLERQAARAVNPALQDERDRIRGILLQNDVYPPLVESLLDGICTANDDLRVKMRQLLPSGPQLQPDADGQKIIALVGPPGAGKTTTLVKLAVRYGLLGRRRAHILSIDNSRIAGADQLRCYSAILGLGFDALESVFSLRQALEEHRAKELVLIDTPGYSSKEMDGAAELAAIFDSDARIERHLVLTASMKPGDQSRLADRFRIFRPARLIFTRLDETESWGQIWSESVRSGLPVSFLACGQQIPEDLEEASPDRILKPLFESLAFTGEGDAGAAGRPIWGDTRAEEMLAAA